MKTKTRTAVAAPDPPEMLTFQFELADGSVVVESVTLDFSDLPVDLMWGVINDHDPNDVIGITATLLQHKLEAEVPVEILKALLENLNRGEGVTLG